MAKRDVRRHRGRSALIMVMVAIPTMLLVFAITAAATSQVTGPEKIPGRMGNGVASLEWPQPSVVMQPFDPAGPWGSDRNATPIPGWVADGSAFDNAQAIGRLTGSTAIPYASESATTLVGDRRLTLESLALDPRPGLTDKVVLESGRLPEREGEALVSQAGERRGLPATGSLAVRTEGAGEGADSTLTIVGTARVLGAEALAPSPDLMVPQPLAAGQPGGGWILLGSDPVTWPEVEKLNTYGLLVFSREVLENPPDKGELSTQALEMVTANATQMRTFVAIGGALLLVITTLLVGPAFAVSASRQRRTLALSASNGANTAQLRHTVLAQALVLGVASALLGTLLGIGSAWLLSRTRFMTFVAGSDGPFDAPLLPIALVTLTAALSAVIAALLPARRLGRLDIVGVMKGQSVSPPPSRTVFLVGAALAVAGGFGVISLAASQAPSGAGGGELKIVVATIALVIGAVMLAPMILVLIARLSSRLPVSLRMATRDAGRQRTRSVPSIAAILAGVCVLTMTLIASGSDEEQSRRLYTARNIAGDAMVSNTNGPAVQDFDVSGLTAALSAIRPGLEVSPVSSIDTGDPWMKNMGNTQPTEPYDLMAVNVVPPGCTPEQTTNEMLVEGESFEQPICHVIGTQGQGTLAAIGVLDPDEIIRRLDVLGHADAAETIRRGGVVLTRTPGSATRLKDGMVTIMSGTQTIDPVAQETGEGTSPWASVRTITVPAVEVEATKEAFGPMLARGMLVPTEVAKSAGWPTYVDHLTVHDPAGPISADLAERLAAAAPEEVGVEVERGFESVMKWVVLVLVGIFSLLLLVVTLTSTALSLAEQENDQATLAALGSGRGTRRIMAAAQAFSLCLIGAVLGLAVGIVPGIALAYPLTAQSYDPITGVSSTGGDPILVFPWLILLGFAVAVPALAAGLAAAGIRKAPNATHRTA